jgi:hypothetical protein
VLRRTRPASCALPTAFVPAKVELPYEIVNIVNDQSCIKSG